LSNIFISYHRDTHDVSLKLKERIESEFSNYNCIIAEDKKRMAVDWSDKVAKHLDECSLVIVLMTETAKTTEWINQELGYAKALLRRKEIQEIVAVVEGAKDEKTGRFEFIKTKGFITDTMDRIKFQLKKPEEMIDEVINYIRENPVHKILGKKKLRIIKNALIEAEQNESRINLYYNARQWVGSEGKKYISSMEHTDLDKVLSEFSLDKSYIEYLKIFISNAKRTNQIIRQFLEEMYGTSISTSLLEDIVKEAQPLSITLKPVMSILRNLEKGE